MNRLLICLLAISIGASPALAATSTEMQAGKTMGQSIGLAGAVSNPLNGASTTFSTVSGGGSYSSLGEPANGGTAGAKANNTYSFTVDCNVTRTKYLGGIGTKNGACSLDANANVASIPFSVCTRSQAGGICGTGDWTSMQSVAKGQSAALAGGKVSIKVVSCSYNTCQATLTDNDQASGTGATLNQQGDALTASEGSDSLAGQQATAYGNPAFHTALRNTGTQLGGCYGSNVSDALNSDGVVKTCDGKQSVSLDPGCKTVTECLAQQTTTRSWNEYCEAEVPLTTKTCTTQTATVDCQEELTKPSFSCSNTLAVEASGTATCTPGTWYAYGGGFGEGGSWHQAYCDPNSVNITMEWQAMIDPTQGACQAPVVFVLPRTPVTISAAQAFSVSRGSVRNAITASGHNWKGHCSYAEYIGFQAGVQGCVNGWCSYSFSGYDTRWGNRPNYYLSFPEPKMSFTYTDTWTNGCSVYEAATQP